jgi:hypothetical protein
LIPLSGYFGPEELGDTRFSRRLSMAADCGFCAVFKDRGEACTPSGLAPVVHVVSDVSTRSPAGAGLSKLNSMLGSLRPPPEQLPK